MSIDANEYNIRQLLKELGPIFGIGTEAILKEFERQGLSLDGETTYNREEIIHAFSTILSTDIAETLVRWIDERRRNQE